MTHTHAAATWMHQILFLSAESCSCCIDDIFEPKATGKSVPVGTAHRRSSPAPSAVKKWPLPSAGAQNRPSTSLRHRRDGFKTLPMSGQRGFCRVRRMKSWGSSLHHALADALASQASPPRPPLPA